MNLLRASLALGALAVAGVASATDYAYVSGMTENLFRTVTIAYNGGSQSVLAGPQTVYLNNASQKYTDAYCVDLAHVQTFGSAFDVTALPANGSLNRGSRIAQLVNKYAGGVASEDQGAALQLAIWDVLVDNGDGISNGLFRASDLSTGTKNYLNSYLTASLSGVSTVATVFNPNSHPGNKNQGLIVPGGEHLTPDAVPEPASLAALGFGALGLLRRRKKSA